MKKEMEREKKFIFRAAAGLLLFLLAYLGNTADVKAVTASISHDETCECGAVTQTFLPGSVHKFRVKIWEDGGSQVPDSEIEVDWDPTHLAETVNKVEIIKTEGTAGWVKVNPMSEEGSETGWYGTFPVTAEYAGIAGGGKDTEKGKVNLDAHYFFSKDFYARARSAERTSVLLLPGETAQLSGYINHYTPEHPEGEKTDVSQYVKWELNESGMRNGCITLSSGGSVEAEKSGYVYLYGSSALPDEYGLVNVSFTSDIYVLRSGEILTEDSLIRPGREDEYIYFRPSLEEKYNFYGHLESGWGDAHAMGVVFCDPEKEILWSGNVGDEIPEPGKAYLVRVPGQDQDAENWVYSIKPEHEHTYGSAVVIRQPTTEMQGMQMYKCLHCEWANFEYMPRLDETDPGPEDPDKKPDPPSTDPTGNENNANHNGNGSSKIETQDGSYDVISSGKDDPALCCRAFKSEASSAVIPDTVAYGGKTYRVTEIAAGAFKNNSKITKVSIGKNVAVIGANAFSGCRKLKTITGAAAVAEIGNGAFQGCKGLKKVNLSSMALTKIGANAFSGCTALTSFTAKSGKLSSIGKKAFYGDKKLGKIILKTTKLVKNKVGSNAFKGIKASCKFQVPAKKMKVYKKIFSAKGAGKKIVVKK